MQFNLGKFEGDTYTKRVRFSKAVLWKDKQISLNHKVTGQFKARGITKVVFEDELKNERWSASVDALRKVAVLKTEGQEKQFYFPIEVFKKEPIDPSKVLKMENAPGSKKMTKKEIDAHEREMDELWKSL